MTTEEIKEFVRLWSLLGYRQLCIVCAQSLLRAAGKVDYTTIKQLGRDEGGEK